MHKYSEPFRSVPNFLNSNSEKNLIGVGWNQYFLEEKTTRMFFCTSWMHLRRHCWIVSAKDPKIKSQSPGKTLNLWKNLPLQTKNEKQSIFFGEVFLKVWKFSAQNREMKKHFLWKKYQIVLLRTYLPVWENNRHFFAQTLTKNAHVLGKILRNPEKRSTLSSPSWMHFRKHLKIFLLEPEYLGLQSKKQPKSPGK